ncbi:MAG: SMI1/KNR4 family protein [Chloroflexota bacterium]
MNIKEFANLLVKNELATSDELQGCSEEEIEHLEKFIGVKLPKTYREFLALIGHNTGIYRRGSDHLYKDLFNLTEDTKEILMKGPFKLPKDAFVIMSHQGYIFTYFRLSDGDDPPVFAYMENESKPKKLSVSFSEYLSKSMEEEISSLNKLKSREKYIREIRSRK